jgi:hypothetical protein
MVISYERPTPDDAVAVLKARLGPIGKGIRWSTVKTNSEELSHAELVKAAESAAKRSLLAGEKRVATAALVDALRDRRETASA